ncbi:hypothetical protein B7P43_G08560 [Cryptotermes secundus]|uniref:Uncharacterized protein n=1 Tax=Cryptotermes secundus TaxID=105785 RepID=A0A2J7QEU3_9NEOP|nr:hypothetical protein B7P43_G08560 [Cryptotermes secundus]
MKPKISLSSSQEPVCLAGASVTKAATLLDVSRATESKVMSAYTDHGKTTSAKRNSGRNSKLT